MTNKTVSDVFDADQAQVIVNLTKEVEALRAEKDSNELVDTKKISKPLAKDQAKLKKATALWKNNGRVPGLAERVTIQDFMKIDKEHTKEMRDSFSNDHPLLIPRVLNEVVREPIEPNIVLTGLLQTVSYQHGTQLTFPSVGAITAADIPEGGEYPERSLEFAGQVVATIGKSGVAVKFSDEMIRYSLYDVMSMHVRAAGKALVRWKEYKVAKMILDNAAGTNTLFDNTTTAYPSTTGRNASGGYNGTITLNDFFRAYATMVSRGFMVDTLIMNPFAWQIFADEGLQRLFGFYNGSPMWNMMQGSPGNAPQWSMGGNMNGLLQNTQVTSPQNVATTYTNMPTLFPYAFKIIVSPYMPYDSVQNVTDMILCDSSQLGVLVVDETVQTESWDDPARDIMKIKFRERYGLGSVNSGAGSGLIKGVYLGQNYDFGHNTVVNFSQADLAFAPLSGDRALVSGLFNANY